MFEYLMHYCIPISSVARRRHFRSARRHYLNTVSARMGVGHLLLPAQLPGTHWVMMCVIWHLAPTVSDVCLQLGCFQSTSTYSALELLHFMRCINSRLTYWLTCRRCVYVTQMQYVCCRTSRHQSHIQCRSWRDSGPEVHQSTPAQSPLLCRTAER